MEPATANTGAKLSDFARGSGKPTEPTKSKPKLIGRAKRARQTEEAIRQDPDVLTRLPLEVLLHLPEGILNELPVDRLHHLPEPVLAKVSSRRLLQVPDPTRLPPSILATFPPERLARLPYTTLITLLDPMRLSPRVIGSFPPDVLETLSPKILEQLSPNERLMLPPHMQEMLRERATRAPKPKEAPAELLASDPTPIAPSIWEPVGQRDSTAAASQAPKVQADAKLLILPFRSPDARPRSGEYAPPSLSKEQQQSGAEMENPQQQLERRASQPSSKHSRESQKRQSITNWLGKTRPNPPSPVPPGQYDLSSFVRRKEHEEKVADLEERFQYEQEAHRAERTKLEGKVRRWESFYDDCHKTVQKHWGQYRERMSEKDREGQIVLNTLVFARELVEWYQQELDKETKSGKEKEARVQERQAELDGLKTRLEEKDAEREAELARLRLVHEKELGEARASLLEQVRKLQSFGKDLLQKAKAAAEEHQKELAETVSELEAQHRDEMDKLVATHQQEKFAAGKEGQLALSTMQDSHATEMDILRAQQKDKMAQLARVHDRQLATQAQLAQQREAQLHEEKMGKLERMSKTQLATESQLRKEQEENEQLHRERVMLHASIQQLQVDTAVQQSQHHEAMSSLRSQKGHLRQAVDGDLRRLFQRLQFGIEVVTEPVNLGDMSLPPGSPLDPDGFIKRNGAGALRFLLRHIVWNVIMNGFFSAPFGFGVFGDGEGRDRLFGLYATWRRLVAPSQQSDGAPTPDFEVFFQDPDANRWRSSTFASMRSATANASSQGPDQPLSPYAANIIKVKQDIVELLSAVTAALPEEINHKVDEIVSLAGEMALETGMHESHLGLLMPASGTSTQIGQEFLDCEDEYTVSQTTGNIELGVCPYFYRIGDGTGDFSTTWAIARGKVYIKRSP